MDNRIVFDMATENRKGPVWYYVFREFRSHPCVYFIPDLDWPAETLEQKSPLFNPAFSWLLPELSLTDLSDLILDEDFESISPPTRQDTSPPKPKFVKAEALILSKGLPPSETVFFGYIPEVDMIKILWCGENVATMMETAERLGLPDAAPSDLGEQIFYHFKNHLKTTKDSNTWICLCENVEVGKEHLFKPIISKLLSIYKCSKWSPFLRLYLRFMFHPFINYDPEYDWPEELEEEDDSKTAPQNPLFPSLKFIKTEAIEIRKKKSPREAVILGDFAEEGLIKVRWCGENAASMKETIKKLRLPRSWPSNTSEKVFYLFEDYLEDHPECIRRIKKKEPLCLTQKVYYGQKSIQSFRIIISRLLSIYEHEI